MTGKTEPADFYDLKGYIENLLALTAFGDKIRFIAKANPAFHPGQSAVLELEGKEVGIIGQIHPNIAQKNGNQWKSFCL